MPTNTNGSASPRASAIFALLNEVLAKKTLRLDMFAYDLNEPDLMTAVLKLAKQGRMRVILDNASLHHSTSSAEARGRVRKAVQRRPRKAMRRSCAASSAASRTTRC